MKKSIVICAVLAIFAAGTAFGVVTPVEMYLDTAPNTGIAEFKTAEYASIYADTFVSQAHGSNSANIGTLNYEVEDCWVYSFPDYGSRLHAFYYVPGETTASLAGRFEVNIAYQWDNVWYNVWDTFAQPGSWINYDDDNDGITDGVMGTMGNAFWGAYGHTTASSEALAMLAGEIQDSDNYLGNMKFMINMDGQAYELEALHTPIPEPATMALLTLGGLLLRRKK